MKPDERYHNEASRIQTGVEATPEPHTELHLRVTTLEGHANNHQLHIEDILTAISVLETRMDKVFTELGLA